MQTISLFCGIRISMCHDDRIPLPHFHAAYLDDSCIVDIQASVVMSGALPMRQLKLVLAWAELHKDELMQDWELAKDDLPLKQIAPLS